MKRLVWLIIPLAFIIFSCARAEKSYPLAPGFTLKDLDGNDISLSNLEGKVIFLNFWATWCPPCREEIPGFVEIYDQYKDKGIEIIGISVDKLGTKSLLAFIEKYKMNYPVVLGTQKVIDDYKPGRFIPVTIIIDKKGKIREKHIGFMDKETLKNYFLKFRAEAE